MSADTTNPADDGHRWRIRLDPVQETLLIPLYGRAVETAKPQGVLRDDMAIQIVRRIDYDFSRFDGGPSLLGTALRTCILDTWTREFLADHPGGAVVELGTGLSSRFDRLDSGCCHWFDLDLPDVIDLRRRFFDDTERRRMIAGSILDPSWMDAVGQVPGPYLFLADGVLPYLDAGDARRVLAAVADRFPGSLLAFDTCGQKMIDSQDRHDTLGKMTARMRWACDSPRDLEELGLTQRWSRTLAQMPRPVRTRLSVRQRLTLQVAAVLNLRDFAHYRVNLFHATPVRLTRTTAIPSRGRVCAGRAT
jgi:O-methyltransferase involved in polyketide biosynthesis